MTNEYIRLLTPALCGAAMLAVWDFLHALRSGFAKGIVINFLLDIAWWIFCAVLLLTATWHTGYAELRFYVFVSLGMGAFLYHITLSKYVRILFCGVFDVFYKIIQFIFKILLTPGVFLYKILLVPFFSIGNRAVKQIKRLRG